MRTGMSTLPERSPVSYITLPKKCLLFGSAGLLPRCSLYTLSHSLLRLFLWERWRLAG